MTGTRGALVARMPRTRPSPTLSEAVARFLRRDAFEPNTRLAYQRTLAVLVEMVGADTPLDQVSVEQVEDLLEERWGSAAATTSNRHRAASGSLFGWAQDRNWVAANPVSLIEPRKVRRRGEDDRREPIDPALLVELWRLDGVSGRDRLLWRMAYETWARADELLRLDIGDLDLGRREGRVHALRLTCLCTGSSRTRQQTASRPDWRSKRKVPARREHSRRRLG